MIHTQGGGRAKSETPFEKFRAFTQKVISVPKAEIDRREAEYQKARKNKRKKRVL
jgi:hypothetical protein